MNREANTIGSKANDVADRARRGRHQGRARAPARAGAERRVSVPSVTMSPEASASALAVPLRSRAASCSWSRGPRERARARWSTGWSRRGPSACSRSRRRRGRSGPARSTACSTSSSRARSSSGAARPGTFLEWAEVHGQLYATPAEFVDEGVRAGRDRGARRRRAGRRERAARAAGRGLGVHLSAVDRGAARSGCWARNTDRPEVVERRLRNAPAELAQYREYDYLVVNDELEHAVAQLVAIVDAERARVRRCVQAEIHRADGPRRLEPSSRRSNA